MNLSEIFEKNLHLGWTNDFFEKKKIRLIKFKPTEILKFTKENQHKQFIDELSLKSDETFAP